MDNHDNNYLTKLKSFFRGNLVKWFSIVSLCVPLLGLMLVFYDQSKHHYYYNDNTFLNSITAVGLLISIFPAVMWILIYNHSKETYSTEAFIKPFKTLKIFSVTVFALETIVSLLFLGFMLISYISNADDSSILASFANALLFFFIIFVFIISLTAFFYLLFSYNFLSNINESFTNPENLNKKNTAYYGYNIFLTVIFIILAVNRLFLAININPNLGTTPIGRIENMILFINFGVIAIKHFLEAQVAKNYFKQTKALAELSEADNTPAISERNLYETSEEIETISRGNVCPKCGESVSEGSMFCNGCGTKLI